MLDLSKPLNSVEGVTLYGDHVEQDLVFYLPDEIDLVPLAPDRPDLSMQIFYPDEAMVGTGDSLESAVGSILSLGVRCEVSQDRLRTIEGVVASQLGLEHVRLTPPPWEDGSVELLLLDSQSGQNITSAVKDDRMVEGIVGSRKPSLQDPHLSALFHARLDRRGTALTVAGLQGEVGSLAGVLYDLKFAAMRPTIDLRMSADLDACAEFFSAGAGVQVYYVSADIQATFGRMRQEGIIKVDLVSQVADPEAERLVNEAVHDFYDVLMRELFRPMVAPAEAVAAAGAGSGAASTSIVKFRFNYTRTTQKREITVDYRKRAASRRTHNPQAHLRHLAHLGGGADRLIQRVSLSNAWREYQVEIAAPSAFDDRSLRQVRVVLWRGKDSPIPIERARDGGLRMPEMATPLADFAFSSEDSKPRQLTFINQPDEPPYYWWQSRFLFADEPDVDSPSEIWTVPERSSSSDLDVFPLDLAPKRQVILQFGAGFEDTPLHIEATILALATNQTVPNTRRLVVGPNKKEARWSVRRLRQHPVHLEASLSYHYSDGRILRLPPQVMTDRELPANDPFRRTVRLTPQIIGTPKDVAAIGFTARYNDSSRDYQHIATVSLNPPDFRAGEIKIPILRPNDKVQWEATEMTTTGQSQPLSRGESEGGIVPVIVGVDRTIKLEWIGPAPADLQLRFVRVMFRLRQADGQLVPGDTVEYRGAKVAEVQAVHIPRDVRAEFAVERRFLDGTKATNPFQALHGDMILVSGTA